MYIKQVIKRYGILSLVFLATLQSCKKSRSDIGAVLFKETKNKVFKKVDSAAYYKVFSEMLATSKDSLSSPQLIENFYKQNNYEPYFIVNFVPKEQLRHLAERYSQASSHGLNPEYFHYSEIKTLTDKIYGKKNIKTKEEAYRDIARLELLTASSLISYSTTLQYGLVNPRKIFARYYMKTEKPDSSFYKKVFAITDLISFLDEVQPKDPSYIKLQEALNNNFVYAGLSPQETKKVIALNLERLRWKNKPATDRYVWVNIADYTLKYVEDGKTNLSMKVCVGKGPDQEPELADYDESEGAVRPHNHQTPQLNSEIYNVQVNPVWNIPESIAKGEIVDHVRKDQYYLANNNIDVYRNGKKVDNDNIDWSEISDGTYSFKQAPGDDNALGKIKFQFLNASNVYLHDTPAQAPFMLDVRAVSHGCVRLEKPLDFARALFGDGEKYNLVKKEVAESTPTSRDIALSEKVPIYLDYVTCFVDDNGQIQI
ncbi:MAG TPA: L,D-transpeptidase, partial [Sphingobacteriaceae bacterium]|nr:L,D-transpeptidase [Sphingobacteriaceae bacterium]